MAGADTAGAQRAAHRLPLAWLTALGVFVIFWLFAKPHVPAAFEYP